MGAGDGESDCVCATRACRSGKQGGSDSSSVGVGGAVGGAFGDVKVLGARDIFVGSLGVAWVVSVAGTAASVLPGVGGRCGCSVSYE